MAIARRTARLNAVQALYQMEITGQGLDYILDNFTHDASLGDETEVAVECDRALFQTLVSAAIERQTQTDHMTAAVLRRDWTLAGINPILRAIFRTAGAELQSPEREPRIVIRDYLDIASAFFPKGREVGLVNGILDTMAKRIRPDAFASPT